MKYALYSILITIVIVSCGQAEGNSVDTDPLKILQEDPQEAEYSDGLWCAEVEYYNSNTGTRSTYDLNVEVEDGYLVQINWPAGGWLDESHFTAEDITDGECSFISDRGYEYTVILVEKGGCRFEDTYNMQRQIEQDIQSVTCPQCNGKKFRYDDLCSDCEDEAQTCPKCMGYKLEWEKICGSCEDEMMEEGEDEF